MKQCLGIEGLVEERSCSLGESALPDVLVSMTCNDDDGQLGIDAFYKLLQLQTLYSRHAHIRDKTASLGKSAGLQCLLGRRKYNCGKCCRPKQTLKRLSNLGVVIYDNHERFGRVAQVEPSLAPTLAAPDRAAYYVLV